VPSAPKWSSEEYDTICDSLEEDKIVENLGLKRRCLFNVLDSFHAIGQLPFDSMHDWMEKIGPTECQSLIMAFLKDGKFTLELYNSTLQDIRLEDYEAGFENA
jgi:pyruvate-formate lyase